MKAILESMGGWPLVEGNKWRDNSWSWQKVLWKMESLGISSDQLFDLGVDVDMKNSSKRTFYVSNCLLRKVKVLKSFVILFHRLTNQKLG